MADGINEVKTVSMGKNLQSLARIIDGRLKFQAQSDGFKPPGFCLLVWAFDGDESTFTHNCDRENLPTALRELADVIEADKDTIRQPGGQKLD